MPGKHAPESPASFVLSLSRAVGGALAAVAVMTILVVALLNRGSAEPQGGGPTIESPNASPTQSASPSASPTVSPSPQPLAPSKVTVLVLNGTARTGLAKATAEDIERAGYKLMGTPANAAATAKSTIFYRKGRRAEALAFQASFPDFTVLKEAPASQETILRVVLGADWPQQT
ncbi:MAG: LytR C-terminal domain-containing protein [Actinomycetota bacterium]|nr:LytR C-terminal domain-containing protein [Actinomycetota bacterium]